MKKIGVLTFHRAINYGAFLQCFSLTERLKMEFPECEIEVVDYIAPKEYRKIFINILLAGYHYGLLNMFLEIKRYRIFTKSLKELPLSDRKFITNDLNKLFAYMDDRYDVIIAGSDAIFNWNQNGFPSAYFLNYNFKGTILSYAASVHGLKFKTIANFERQYCKESFRRFAFIGVRDTNTDNFVHDCNNDLKPIHTCDPTLFIELKKTDKIAGDLKGKLEKKYKLKFDKPIIVIMLQQENINRIIKERYGKEYQIVSLFKPSKYADVYLYDLNPFEWTMFLSMVKITFTQYFHGTLLSLKNNKPVIVIDRSNYDGEYESKLKDLMVTRLNLQDLYFTKTELEHPESINRMLEISDKAIKGIYDTNIRKSIIKESECIHSFLKTLKSL